MSWRSSGGNGNLSIGFRNSEYWVIWDRTVTTALGAQLPNGSRQVYKKGGQGSRGQQDAEGGVCAV